MIGGKKRPMVDNRPFARISVSGCKFEALFDTGSILTLVDSKYRQTILAGGGKACKSPSINLCGAGGSPLETQGSCVAMFGFGKKRFEHEILFVKHLKVPCIVGMDLMEKAHITLDPGRNKILLSQNSNTITNPITLMTSKPLSILGNSETSLNVTSPTAFKLGLIEPSPLDSPSLSVMDGLIGTHDISGTPHCSIVISNFGPTPIHLPKGTELCQVDISTDLEVFSVDYLRNPPSSTPTPRKVPVDLSNVPWEYRDKYLKLLESFSDVFSKDDLDVGHCKSLPHKVRLKDPNRITSINQYRLPHHLKQVAIDYVSKLLQAGVVRKSSSVFNSPLMLVKKPHADPKKPLAEQYRLVHNYIDLNKNISPCSYPLRNLYELLDEVSAGKIFSVLDLSQGFFQQALDDPEESTSFSIPGFGQFSYTRSPQGLNSSPAYFQRLLDFVLKEISNVFVYIDDVVISVQTHEENLARLEQVFIRFREHNLKIKPSKCAIGSAKITYLGYEISAKQGISPGKAKTEVIANWPEPTSVKDIRAFIGLTSFFRRAIKDFSLISGPLNKLIRKDSNYSKGPLPELAKLSFQQLKKALISKPCLQPVDFSRRFYVTCDASATHYGSCLSQIGADKVERPCGYSSKLLSEREAKQTPGLRERASLLHALRHWQPYLVGKEFTLRTDHKPNLSISSGRTKIYDTLTDEILQYQPFLLEYLPGKSMFVDALSRPPNAISLANLSSPLEIATVQPDRLAEPSISDIRLGQLNDQKLGAVIQHLRLKNGPSKSYNDLTLNDHGLLTTKQGLIIIPDGLKSRLLYLAHDQAGHLSVRYIVDNIKKKYVWTGLNTDAKHYAASCVICSQANSFKGRTRMPLETMSPTAIWFNDRIHLDIVDMPKATSGHLAVITIVDAATGFCILVPSRNKTGNAVIEALTKILFPNFGVPKLLVTDRGKENVNEAMSKLLQNYGIGHILTSVAHPQSNGMVERRQQMISSFFKKHISSYADQLNWPARIPELQTIINSSKSQSRGFSPFFLTFFRQNNFPFGQLLHSDMDYEDSSVAAKVNSAMRAAKTAHENYLLSFATAKNQFDKAVRANKIETGSVVYVATSQRGRLHHKFGKRFRGPYLCLNIDSNILDLRPLGGGNKVKAHVNNCKLGTFREQLFDFRFDKDKENTNTDRVIDPPYYELLTPTILDDTPTLDPPEIPQADNPHEAESGDEEDPDADQPNDQPPVEQPEEPTQPGTAPEPPRATGARPRAPRQPRPAPTDPGAATRRRTQAEGIPLNPGLPNPTRRKKQTVPESDPLPFERAAKDLAKRAKEKLSRTQPK